MVTLSAAQHNPAITAFYRRLRDADKPPKVARRAAARKLLHLIWAIGTKAKPCDSGCKQQQHTASSQLAA